MTGLDAAALKPVTVMEGFSKEMSGANQRTVNVVRRLTELNAKLWGPIPVAQDSGKEVKPPGLIYELQSDLSSLHVQLDVIDAALDRLEQLV